MIFSPKYQFPATFPICTAIFSFSAWLYFLPTLYIDFCTYSFSLFPLEVIYHFYGFRILCPAFQPLQYLEPAAEELWSVEALCWLGLLHLPRLCCDLGTSWFCRATDSWGGNLSYSQEKKQCPAGRATTPTCKKMWKNMENQFKLINAPTKIIEPPKASKSQWLCYKDEKHLEKNVKFWMNEVNERRAKAGKGNAKQC